MWLVSPALTSESARSASESLKPILSRSLGMPDRSKGGRPPGGALEGRLRWLAAWGVVAERESMFAVVASATGPQPTLAV